MGNHVPVLDPLMLSLVVLDLSLLADQGLSCLAKHALLLPVMIESVLVLHATGSYCSDDIVPLIEAITLFILSLCLLLLHGGS